MKAYLTQLPSLKGKKVGCFVTHMFPFAWMGGNSAMKQFKDSIELVCEQIVGICLVRYKKMLGDGKNHALSR